jgi:hypothetical protein
MSKATKVILALLALVLFGGYYYSDVLLHYGDADAECIKLAEGSKMTIAFTPDPDDKKIFVVKKWIRGGHVVVELGQKMGDKKGYYNSRLCVIGGGQIMIPSMLEQWQYR